MLVRVLATSAPADSFVAASFLLLRVVGEQLRMSERIMVAQVGMDQLIELLRSAIQAVQAVVALIFDFSRGALRDLESFRASASSFVGTDFGRWPVAVLS